MQLNITVNVFNDNRTVEYTPMDCKLDIDREEYALQLISENFKAPLQVMMQHQLQKNRIPVIFNVDEWFSNPPSELIFPELEKILKMRSNRILRILFKRFYRISKAVKYLQRKQVFTKQYALKLRSDLIVEIDYCINYLADTLSMWYRAYDQDSWLLHLPINRNIQYALYVTLPRFAMI